MSNTCKNDKARFYGMVSKPETPKVGVGVILRDEHDRVLLILRKGSHGAGLWSLPGGHMELGESFDNTCKRELEEELFIKIDDVTSVGFTNDIFDEEGLHYVTLYFETRIYPSFYADHVPVNMEPDKAEQIKWFTVEEIKACPNLFPALRNILQLGGIK